MKSKGKLKYYIILCLKVCFLLGLTGCSEIFVEDFSDKTLLLTSPADGIRTTNRMVTFSWDAISSDAQYRIRVVKGTFTQTEALLVDSTITETSWDRLFDLGSYQWQLEAFNAESSVFSTVRTFNIDTASSLSQSKIILLSPIENSASNQLNIPFNWEKDTLAEDYRFEIREDQIGGNLYEVQIISSNAVEFSFQDEGIYFWGVQGQSQFAPPTEFSYSKITVDSTPPSKPVLNTPSSKTTVNSFPLVFNWSRPIQGLSAEVDSIHIFSVSGVDTNYSYRKELPWSTKTFSADTLPNGDYFWLVQSFDRAGNAGLKSTVVDFKVLTQ